MDQLIDDFNHEQDNGDINESNLLKKIWTKPRPTLRFILKNCPDKYMYVLFILGGVVNAIDRASYKGLGDTESLMFILTTTITTGALFGWIGYVLYAWLLSRTGRLIKGNGNAGGFRTIIAWSLVPSITALFLLIPEIIIFGIDLFKSEVYSPTLFTDIVLIGFGSLEIVLGVWTLVILVNGVMVVQGFGIGKAILNLFLPILIIFVPIFLIVYFAITT